MGVEGANLVTFDLEGQCGGELAIHEYQYSRCPIELGPRDLEVFGKTLRVKRLTRSTPTRTSRAALAFPPPSA